MACGSVPVYGGWQANSSTAYYRVGGVPYHLTPPAALPFACSLESPQMDNEAIPHGFAIDVEYEAVSTEGCTFDEIIKCLFMA